MHMTAFVGEKKKSPDLFVESPVRHESLNPPR